ncbi:MULTISPECIES: methionine aminopeptidase [Leucobacter]|uniref:methionine aminopeptidase n=1 Tax=Leucobacter TaxID=55968 RepID=UPI0021041EEB|nr:methionine aminopeptidase [Leucobacter aridicollis]UTX51772.1 methionine aminopeptidase [Leucobacter aridicollis]
MSKKDWGIDDPEETYWFNSKTGEVEEGPQSLAIYRIGPFKTRDEARRAPQLLAERAREWNEEDEEEY